MIEYVLQALDGIFTIVLVVGIGYVLSKKGWFDDKTSSLIAKLVTTVSLPLYMITSLTKNFTAEKLIKLAPDMMLPVCSMLLAMMVGKVFMRLLNVRTGRKGVFITNFFIANTMFIGLPVNLALFGDESIPSVMLYYMVNLIFFWTLGVQNIVADVTGTYEGLFSTKVLKKLWSPPLMGFVAAIVLIILNVQLPRFLMRGFQYVGNLTTPLSLIFIGIEIAKINLKEFNFERDIIGGLFGRFVVCPLCVLALVPFVSVSPISVKVFTMQATMPAMTQMAIVCKQYGGDSQFAAALSFITILFGLLVIPVYMTVVNLYF
ncbi:MAG: AEC family transporter [Phascolarctobacterium sp.]|nr:AEC family transporter [Phascolarctobacterium sp.]